MIAVLLLRALEALLGLGLLLLAPGEDWPAWRGPERNGISRETGWKSEGPVLWRRDVGLGYSSPSIAGARLYTLGFDPATSEDVLWCLSAERGEELWSVRTPAERMALQHGGGTLTTPAVGEGLVLVTGRTGLVRCLDAETGELRWSLDLVAEEQVEPTAWGFGGSPVLLEDMVLVNALCTFALSLETGEVLWRSLPHQAMYSTPQLAELGGQEHVVVFAKQGLVALEAGSGAEVARYPWQKHATTVNASTPLVVGPDRVFFSSGYGHGAALVRFEDEAFAAEWETRAMRTQHSGCVLVDGHLYGFDEQVLKCLGLDGKERWRKRGLGMGALSAADGRLLVTSKDGELLVLEATPEAYRELGRIPAVRPGVLWTPPVLCRGRAYLRSGEGELACVDLRGPRD